MSIWGLLPPISPLELLGVVVGIFPPGCGCSQSQLLSPQEKCGTSGTHGCSLCQCPFLPPGRTIHGSREGGQQHHGWHFTAMRLQIQLRLCLNDRAPCLGNSTYMGGSVYCSNWWLSEVPATLPTGVLGLPHGLPTKIACMSLCCKFSWKNTDMTRSTKKKILKGKCPPYIRVTLYIKVHSIPL